MVEKISMKEDLPKDINNSMLMAIYVKSKFPELTIKQCYQVLDDPMFILYLFSILEEICNE